MLFKFDKDANFMEKFATVFVPLFAGALLVWLFGSCLGIFHNQVANAAAIAPAWSHTVGFILLAAAGVTFWANASDRVPFRVSDTVVTIAIVLLLILSVSFYCGFWIGVF